MFEKLTINSMAIKKRFNNLVKNTRVPFKVKKVSEMPSLYLVKTLFFNIRFCFVIKKIKFKLLSLIE